MIICAAIKINFIDSKDTLQELVVCGHRHSDCFKVIHRLDNKHTESKIQGFITHKGEFVDRKGAYTHAVVCGQINQHNGWFREDNKYEEKLYSEDLY